MLPLERKKMEEEEEGILLRRKSSFTLDQLRDVKWLQDTIISCKDGWEVSCQMVVLGAGSPFLRQLLVERSGEEEPLRILMPDFACHQVEGLLSFLYTGACSLSPDRADILNILQVEGFPPKVGSEVQTEASLNRDVKEEVLFSELEEQFQNCETAPEPEEGECVNRFNDSERSDGEDDEWKPDLKLVVQGNKAKTKVVPRLEEQRKLFDKEVNIEVLLKQINTDPEMSLKQMELSGIPVYHYPCDHCGQSCPELQQYAEHVKTEHPEKVAMFDQRYRTYQCLHCKMCFLSRKERRAHVGKLHKSASQADSVRSHRVFVCPHCKVEWKSAKNTKKLEAFLEHLIRHKLGPKGLWCANCPDKFDTFNTLRRHVSATHLSSQTVCPQCGEICRDNHALKKHNQKAHVIKEDSPKKKEEIHVCDLCAKQFPSYGKLWYHKSSAHKDPSKYLTCEVCGKKLIDKSRFEVHMALHKPPSIACPHCRRLFHTDRYLDRHIKSQHTSASKLSFNCDQCGKGFYSSQKLSDHMNVHMGVKPYACRYCSNCYQNLSNCRNHERKSHPDLYTKQPSKF